MNTKRYEMYAVTHHRRDCCYFRYGRHKSTIQTSVTCINDWQAIDLCGERTMLNETHASDEEAIVSELGVSNFDWFRSGV